MVPAPAEDWYATPPMTGRLILLERLSEVHAADLLAGADEGTVQFLSRGGPSAPTVKAWAEYITALNALPHRVNWAVKMQRTGVVVGRISYSEIKVDDHWVEVGTMLLPAAQGTGVNAEAKLLLLTRAFEVLGAGRVQFKVDARNARSRAAMRKLGALEEGVLRQYQVRADGLARDSVMYSLLPGEWPAVKQALQERVSAAQSS